MPKVRSGDEGKPVMAELEEHMEGQPGPVVHVPSLNLGYPAEAEPEDLNWHADEADDA